MFEILQYICGYSSDKRTKEKSNKNKYICIDRDMWWAGFWELFGKSHIFYLDFWFDLEIVWLYNIMCHLVLITTKSQVFFLPSYIILYCHRMAVILKFTLHDVSLFFKGPVKSLKVHFHNKIVPVVTFHLFQWQKYMYTQYLWHLNRVPMQESRLTFRVSSTTERTAIDPIKSSITVFPPIISFLFSENSGGHSWNSTPPVQLYRGAVTQHRWRETSLQRLSW